MLPGLLLCLRNSHIRLICNNIGRVFSSRKPKKSTRQIWDAAGWALCHSAKIYMEILMREYPNRVISRFGDVEWLRRSPDHTPLDFYLRLLMDKRRVRRWWSTWCFLKTLKSSFCWVPLPWLLWQCLIMVFSLGTEFL